MWVRSTERVDGLERKGGRTEWDSKTRGAGGTTWFLNQSAKAKGGLLLPEGLLKSTSLFPEPPYSLVFPQLSLWLLVPAQSTACHICPLACPVTLTVHCGKSQLKFT